MTEPSAPDRSHESDERPGDGDRFLPKGARVGAYTLLRPLGEGGMGRVYLARSPGGRLIAVKTIHPHLLRDPRFRERFRTEVAAARRVGGAYTAAVLDGDADAPIPWLASAYLPAPSLQQQVDEQGPLAAPAVRRLAAGLAEALAAVHAAGVVHRDLKPGNVLLSADGPRVIDFGISAAAEPEPSEPSGASDESEMSAAFGSPGYVSPERLAGRPATEAADVFALGGVLCFAATGDGPFGSGAAAVVSLRAAALAPDLDAIEDPLIRTLAGHCLAADPELRPTTDEILGMLAGRPFAPGDRARADTAGQAGARRRRQRVLFGSSAAVAGVAAITVVLALTLPGPRNQPSPTPTATGTGTSAASAYAWSVPGSAKAVYLGVWGGTSTVVLGRDSGLTAYDAATGRSAWSWHPPQGYTLCGMSPATDGGVGVFDYGKPSSSAGTETCDQLQAIDVDSGKTRWPSALRLTASASAAPSATGDAALSIVGGLVSAPYASSASSALTGVGDVLLASAQSGKSAWATGIEHGGLPGGCSLDGPAQAFDGRIYALGDCANGKRIDLFAISGGASADVTDTGQLAGCVAPGDDAASQFLIADTDYLIADCSDNGESSYLYALRAGSAAPRRLSTGANGLMELQSLQSSPLPSGLLLRGAILYLTTPQDVDPSPQDTAPATVVAVDLGTGKPAWSHAFPGQSTAIPLTTTPTGVNVLIASSTAGSAALETLSAASGAAASNSALTAAQQDTLSQLNNAVDAPYGVQVGTHVVLAFSDATDPGDPMLALLR